MADYTRRKFLKVSLAGAAAAAVAGCSLNSIAKCAAPTTASTAPAAVPAISGDLSDRRTYYVNNVTGLDSYDGLTSTIEGKSGPLASIMQAVKKASVGAVISVANTGVDYRESVQIERYNKGTAAVPLVIDGNGATVTGLLEAPARRWAHLRDDIYWTENKLDDGAPGAMPSSNWLGHYKHQGWFTEPQSPRIFFINGKQAPNVLKLEDIPAGGFFYDTQSNPRRIYFRLPEGKKIKDVKIEFPQNAGVYVSDDYVVVRNLRSIYSSDDGFSGFWGIGVVFENIDGSYNCDQGFSVHGTSVSIVDGGLFERNGGCGICDVMSSTSIFRNVVVRDNMITGAMMMGLNHSFLNCRFYGNAACQVSGNEGTNVMMVNCLIDGKADNVTGASLSYGRLDHCTIVNCRQGVGINAGSVMNSIIADCPAGLILAAKPVAIGKTILGLGTASLAGETVDTAKWSVFAAAHKEMATNLVDSLRLKAPLYCLPKGSKYEKWGDYGMTPGAVLPPYEGWKPIQVKNPVPHP